MVRDTPHGWAAPQSCRPKEGACGPTHGHNLGTPSHLGHMDRVAATMPSQAHAGAAQEAPDIGQWEGQDVPLVRPSSCNVKGGIPSSRRYLPTTFTYTSATLTDLIKKTTTWRWGPQEQQVFDKLKDKVSNDKCLAVPRAQGEILLVTDASNLGGGGTLFQWQALEKEEFDSAISQWGTDGLNRDITLKHSYPDDKWVLVPLSHWNWKWNQARGNYSTYEQELLAGMLVLSSQSRLLGSNPVVWLCDQEPVRTFQKGPPPEKAKFRRWWTYLSQLRLSVHHIQGVENECADYVSRNDFNDMIGPRSEELAKEAFSRMKVHLDLNITMIRRLDGLRQVEYVKEFGDIYNCLEKRLEPVLVNQEQWKRDKT